MYVCGRKREIMRGRERVKRLVVNSCVECVSWPSFRMLHFKSVFSPPSTDQRLRDGSLAATGHMALKTASSSTRKVLWMERRLVTEPQDYIFFYLSQKQGQDLGK